jgi:DNA polymerase-3 subunit delta
MKFQTVQAFERHLQDTPKQQLGSLFAVVAIDFLERKLLVDKIVAVFKKDNPSVDVIKMEISDQSLLAIKEELETFSLFSSNKVLVLKEVEKASKSLLDNLSTYFKVAPAYPVIFEGHDFKNDPKFYEKLKKEMIVIELTKEKPWEKKQRILNWVEGFCKKEKKTLSKDVLESLYEKCHKDLSLVMQEVEKLVIYTGQEAVITLAHLHAICGAEGELNLWTLAEAIVWQDAEAMWLKSLEFPMDTAVFYPFLGQLRYHYQQGLKIFQLTSQGLNFEELSQKLPQLQPKHLQRYYASIQKFSANYFTQALLLLFEIDIQSKSRSLDLQILWIDLLTRLKNIKKR